MSDRLHWIEEELSKLDQLALRRHKTIRQSPPVGGMVQVDGRQFINFGSNDYLGIAACDELIDAVQSAIGQLGFGTGASPVVTGRGTLHQILEEKLATFEGTESAILFPSGYAANIGAICSLVGRGDVVFSDELNHASIIDGCRLSRSDVSIYPHKDTTTLSEHLGRSSGYRRRLIVTDSLFSMDGDIAPLLELSELAEQHNAMLLVDEAHATGVFGNQGRGCCELSAVEDRVDIRIGTLSKALGCQGGFVAGSQILIDWIRNKARPYVFSTAQPEITSAAALAALKIVIEQPERRQVLLARSRQLRNRLNRLTIDTGESESQIIPVKIGGAMDVVHATRQLMECGIYVPGIRPPTVPEGKSILRISLSYAHSTQQIDALVSAFSAIFDAA